MDRLTRKKRLTKKVVGTAQFPRLCVYRSLKHIEAQIIDDAKGKTIVSATSKNIKNGNKMDLATKVGQQIANKAKAKKITKVKFDRGGFAYHGQIKALADGARKTGLEF